MSNYLIVMDGVEVLTPVSEFLAGVQDRIPDVRFFVLVLHSQDETPEAGWLEASRLACLALETLRGAGLRVIEAIVPERGPGSIEEELSGSERYYQCILRFSPFRRGIHVQRITPASRRRRDAAAAPLLAS